MRFFKKGTPIQEELGFSAMPYSETNDNQSDIRTRSNSAPNFNIFRNASIKLRLRKPSSVQRTPLILSSIILEKLDSRSLKSDSRSLVSGSNDTRSVRSGSNDARSLRSGSNDLVDDQTFHQRAQSDHQDYIIPPPCSRRNSNDICDHCVHNSELCTHNCTLHRAHSQIQTERPKYVITPGNRSYAHLDRLANDRLLSSTLTNEQYQFTQAIERMFPEKPSNDRLQSFSDKSLFVDVNRNRSLSYGCVSRKNDGTYFRAGSLHSGRAGHSASGVQLAQLRNSPNVSVRSAQTCSDVHGCEESDQSFPDDSSLDSSYHCDPMDTSRFGLHDASFVLSITTVPDEDLLANAILLSVKGGNVQWTV